MGTVWNRYGEAIGTTSGKSYTDTSSRATDTHGGGSQAGQTWSGGGSSTPSSNTNSNGGNGSSSNSGGSSSSSGSSSSGGISSGSSSGGSSSGGSNSAQWWQSNFGYVPSWVSGGSTTPSTSSTPSTPSNPPASSNTGSGSSGGGSDSSTTPAAGYNQQILDQIRAGNTSLGWSEIAKAGQDYNSYANDPTRQSQAHDWANQVRNAMGVSSQYDSTTGQYTGGGSNPNPYSGSTGSGGNSNVSTPPATPPGGTNNQPLVPNSPQFQRGAYEFNSSGQTVPVDLGNGSSMNGVMKDGYTYVPIRQFANMTGSQIGRYDDQNLTIEVNGVPVPVHIDANGVGYTPVRNMANTMGADVGWTDNGSGVSRVTIQPGQQQQQPVIDQQKLLEEQQLAERQKMIEELMKQFQQPIPMPQIPNMPEIPQTQPNYQDFLEKAREMINPAYAQARETISKVNQQQRQLLMQRLAAKGQPVGGLREEMEMQLSQDFMNQLSDQDMQQLSEAIKVAQSLSDKDEENAKWLADQAWQRWQAQANTAQQQYQYAVTDRNNRLTGLMNLSKYLQDEEQNRQAAALEQAKFEYQQKKDLYPYTMVDANTKYRQDTLSADKMADVGMEQYKWTNPSANSQLDYNARMAQTQAYANRATNPTATQIKAQADAIANQFAPTLQKYASWEDMWASVNNAAAYIDPYVADSLRSIAQGMKPLYYSSSVETGQNVTRPKAGAGYSPTGMGNPGGLDPFRVDWNNSGLAGSQFGNKIPGVMPEDLAKQAAQSDGTYLSNQPETPWYSNLNPLNWFK